MAVIFSDLPLDPDVSPTDLSQNVRTCLAGFRLLMSTFPGTCLMGQIDFGCNLDKFTFDIPDRTNAILIANEIESAVKRWCTDIVLPRSNIQVLIREDGDGYDVLCRISIPALGIMVPANFTLGVNV